MQTCLKQKKNLLYFRKVFLQEVLAVSEMFKTWHNLPKFQGQKCIFSSHITCIINGPDLIFILEAFRKEAEKKVEGEMRVETTGEISIEISLCTKQEKKNTNPIWFAVILPSKSWTHKFQKLKKNNKLHKSIKNQSINLDTLS